MILYITDNPYLKKDIPGAILAYQIYDWRVLYDKENSDLEIDFFKIKKSPKRKEILTKLKETQEVIAIVAESNYKLQYELLENNTKYFLWHRYLKKRKMYSLKKRKVKSEFLRYLQRSYLSRAIYDKLAALNMQRIEQLLIYIALYKYKTKKDNKEIDYLFETDRLINAISCSREDFSYIIDKLIYHSRKLHISDPFVGSFDILDEKNSLYKIYDKFKESKKTELTKVFLFILNELKDIIPYVDILKTMRYMENNELIKISEAGVFYKLTEVELEESFEFLNKDIWNEFYDSRTFMIGLFPSMSFLNELYFKCPLCGSTELKSSPLNFWCSNDNCNFKVKRYIAPAGVPKNIAEKDLFRMLKFGDTIIKNKYGGYNRFFLYQPYKNSQFYIKPKIYDNDINPDKETSK